MKRRKMLLRNTRISARGPVRQLLLSGLAPGVPEQALLMEKGRA